MIPPPAISAHDLRFHYGKRCALNGVSFEVALPAILAALFLLGLGLTALRHLMFASDPAIMAAGVAVTSKFHGRQP